MKLHRFFILTGLILAALLILWIGLIIYRWNRPQYDSFATARDDYDRIAELVIARCSGQQTHDTIEITQDCQLMLGETFLSMTAEDTEALKRIQAHARVNGNITFSHIWVTPEYVIFWRDERHDYGLLYTQNPLKIARALKADWYDSMEYHYLAANWLEIGVFGI